MTWIIALTSGRWQRYSIKLAKSMGIKVFAIDADPNAEGFEDADISFCVDIFDTDAIIAKLNSLNIKPDGVSNFTSEAGMIPAAELREVFNLNGIKKAEVPFFTNKSKQRERWDASGVFGPSWITAQTFEEAKRKINHLNYPVIIKPVDSAGSRGITKLDELYFFTKEIFHHAISNSRKGLAIIEEFIEGTEYTAEVFAHNGVIQLYAVTEKKKVPGTSDTVANQLFTPVNESKIFKEIEEKVIKAFKAVGLRNGPGHAELIISNQNKIALVEVAGRGGGFMVFDKLIPKISGFNIAKATILNACGFNIDDVLTKVYSTRNAAVLRFFPSQYGLIQEITGFDEAMKIPGVEAGPFVKEGDKLGAAKADGDRMGYILSVAQTPEIALSLADQAEAKIEFKIGNYNDN